MDILEELKRVALNFQKQKNRSNNTFPAIFNRTKRSVSNVPLFIAFDKTPLSVFVLYTGTISETRFSY